MRQAIALLLVFTLSPCLAGAVESGFDVRATGRPAAALRAGAGLKVAAFNQFDNFVRYSAEKKFFETMASNTAYFRDVFTGGETFHSSPNDGDSYSARLFGPTGALITTWSPIVFHSTFNGQQNCWVGFFGGNLCDATEIFITWFIQSQCFADGTYRMEFLYNGQVFSQGTYDLLPEIPPDSLPADLSLWNQLIYDGSNPTLDHYDKRCYDTDPKIRHDCDGRAGEKFNFIKQLGCYLTSASLVSTYQGLPLAPRDLNVILNGIPGGFRSGDVQPDKVEKMAQDRHLELSFLGNKPIAALRQNVCQFGPQLVGVKCNAKHIAGHWVMAYGFDPTASSFKIWDPAGGQRTTLAKYGNATCGTRVFSGPEFVVTINSKIFTSFHSPVELLITDPQGRRLGIDPATGQLFEEIPDAYYDEAGLDDDETGEPEVDPAKQLFLPRPTTGDYTITAVGTGDGSYSADFITADVNGTESEVNAHDVPIALGAVQTFTLHYDSSPGSVLQLQGGFNGGGQRPRDVNQFLSYGNPTQSPVQVAAGTATFPLLIFYGSTTDPLTFSADLNGSGVTALFHPAAGTFEVVELPLASGRNVLKASIDGNLPGRVATDSDRLVFQVP